MRKAIIATIVASALFAVGAFAANFTVQSEDVASGRNAVSACATNVEITFNEPTYTNGIWTVTEATATFFNLAGDPVVRSNATACNGFDADLALDLSDESIFQYDNSSTGTAVTVGTTTATRAIFSLGTGGIDVATIVGASVAVDGIFLDAPL